VNDQEEQIQTALRMPKSVMKRLDKLAALMSQPGLNPITRTEVLRRAALMGIERLEAEQKKR
jgi:predicted DNA-binding protein